MIDRGDATIYTASIKSLIRRDPPESCPTVSTIMKLPITLAVLFLVSPAVVFAVNYDEAEVPKYELPDPLVMADGTRVANAAQWRARRAELLALCQSEMYGQSPGPPERLSFKQVDNDAEALGGKAIRRQVIAFLGGEDGPQMHIVIYAPKSSSPVPAFVGVNFRGNHGINDDPQIRVSSNFIAAQPEDKRDEASVAATRGAASSRWPLETIVSRGYAVATVYCGDIDPDYYDEFKNGIHAMYPELQNRGDNFSTIGAWAWGLSRVMDYFETDPQIDQKRVAVFGHSRMGKTAIWAGATDERFAMVISNDSGAGGAALSRRAFGETVAALNQRFPHWFCKNFEKYNNNEAAIPFDQHSVLSLVAPRSVYVASAAGDRWADPRGEFLSLKHASPVYELLGKTGLAAKEWPGINRPVHGTLGYHIRDGKHDINDYDWGQYLNFADEHLAN